MRKDVILPLVLTVTAVFVAGAPAHANDLAAASSAATLAIGQFASHVMEFGQHTS